MSNDELEVLTKVGIPIVTFVLGFLVSRFTMSKAERRKDQRERFDLAQSLMKQMEATFIELTSALKAYINAEEVTFDHFVEVATTGEKYLYQAKIASDAILTGNISPQIRDETLVPKIKDCATRTLPQIYETLNQIAKKKGFQYSGELDRNKYLSIYTVAEKYGSFD